MLKYIIVIINIDMYKYGYANVKKKEGTFIIIDIREKLYFK